MNQTEDEDEDEEEDEQQSSETKHEPNEEEKKLLMGATTYQEGRKALKSLRTRSFEAMRIWAKVVDRSRIRRFSGGREKEENGSEKNPRTRTFSRDVGGSGDDDDCRQASNSFTHHLSHLSDSYAPDVPTPLLLRLIALSGRVKDTANSIFRAASHSFSFPQSFFPLPSVTDGCELSFGRSCGSHRSGLERNSSRVVMELGHCTVSRAKILPIGRCKVGPPPP
jgi:hypothetical protein